MRGRIIKIISNDYTVKTSDGEYICKSRGKFRNMNITPLVGDIVTFDIENRYIMSVDSRKNYLVRPPVSNIDQAFIIASVKHPSLDLNLLDKLVCIIEFNNVKPIICFTKLDLLDKQELEQIESYILYYQKIGYTVLKNTEIEKIKKSFKHKISVFTGQSGAGKSTLLNKLNPDLLLKTDEISYALGRGKHTTRHVELIDMYGGLVADTPGFSALSLLEMNESDIRDNFVEFNEYKDFCKYRDCMHDKEVDCEVKRQVEQGRILQSRYQNYLGFIHPKKER